MENRVRKNNLVLIELFIYALLPLVIWNYGRDIVGDYAAMLASTLPGLLYTIYRFIVDRQFNILGTFTLASLALNTTVNLLSGSAEQMLWNGVYLSLFYLVLNLFFLVIRRPLSLYFAVDFAFLQGHDRKDSKALFFKKGIFKWFQIIQSVFVIRSIFLVTLTVYLLRQYGVEGYNSMLIYKQIVGWFFSIIITVLFFYTNVPIKKYLEKVDEGEGEEEQQPSTQDGL